MNDDYLSRIDFQGDLSEVFKEVMQRQGLGSYEDHKLISTGYEDVNFKVDTDSVSFFIKIFASSRSDDECERFIEVTTAAIDAGVKHPQLLSPVIQKSGLRLVVMEWLSGETFFDSGSYPSDDELIKIIEQAVLINSISIKPDFIYDSWALPNLAKEYNEWNHTLSDDDRNLIEPVVQEFSEVDLDALPQAFVHGDLISTNIMKTSDGLYVLDFSVSNVYPRIQELAVLFCDVLLGREELALDEYRKHIELTKEELDLIPIYTKAAHAMHILGASRAKTQGKIARENDYLLLKGRTVLQR